jgi:glycerol-3-phosphate O-acyltransferase / dihydroxyacetone phosphate acyltransferase
MIGSLARLAARTFFRKIIIEGIQSIPTSGPVLFTPNHPNGLLDPMLLFCVAAEKRLRFVAKAPLFKIPLFGAILRSIGAIPVVRKFEASGGVDYSAFFSACVDALQNGDSIVIFPEGRSLPQAYLAPLKTGPARLFLMAKERGIAVKIIPVGLNYEKGMTFRSRVLISIAPPLETLPYENVDSSAAVRQLTDLLSKALHANVLQAQSYEERELMILLERLSSQEASNFKRFERLKLFERALNQLRITAAKELETLRSLLIRYDRLTQKFEIGFHNVKPDTSKILSFIFGGLLAIPGYILNWLPYHLCDILIKFTKRDASDAATYKVIYSLLLFPLFYFVEGFLISKLLGDTAALLFAIGIIPASYYTLFFTEWYRENLGSFILFSSRERVSRQLEHLKGRIIDQLEVLSAKVQA